MGSSSCVFVTKGLKMKKNLCLLGAALSLSVLALTPEEADRFTEPKKNAAQLLNLSFEPSNKTTKLFRVGNEGKIVPDEGCNGTSALKVVRTDPKKYTLNTYYLGMLPFAEYTVKFYMKSLDLKRITTPKGWLGVACVEFTVNGKWHSGRYLRLEDHEGNPIPGSNWRAYTFTFRPPVPTAHCHLSLYIERGSTGTLWFDDLTISSNSSVNKPILLQPATAMTIREKDTELVFQVPNGVKNNMLALIKFNGEKKLVKVGKDHKFRAQFKNLKEGKAPVTISIIDPSAKVKLCSETYALNVNFNKKAPTNAVLLDKYGRVIVDGKPFMPLGMYAYPTQRELNALKEARMNCILCYSTIRGLNNKRTIQSIKEQMDQFQSYGLKVIFSVKDQIGRAALTKMEGVTGKYNVAEYVVKKMKGHPALLAWYITDELEMSRIYEAVKLRNVVSAADPWHPTWSITYRSPDMPDYAITGDITGMDPYPIRADQPHSDIRYCLTFSDLCRASGQPFWMIPQAFPWGVYDKKKDVEKYRKSHIPTLDELTAMPLLCAARGSRGFVFYSAYDLLLKTDRLIPGSSKPQWERFKKVVELLQWMEPYIMCEQGAREIKIKANKNDMMYGATFERKKGDIRVIVVGIDTAVSGEFTVPGYPNLKSKLGRTKNLGGGRYCTTFSGVQADILY